MCPGFCCRVAWIWDRSKSGLRDGCTCPGKGDDAAECAAVEEMDECRELEFESCCGGIRYWIYFCCTGLAGVFRVAYDAGGKREDWGIDGGDDVRENLSL